MHKLLYNKKIPIIRPVLFNGKLIFDFRKKLILSSTTLLLNVLQVKLLTNYLTLIIKLTKILTSFNVREDYVLLIIKNLKYVRLVDGMNHQEEK